MALIKCPECGKDNVSDSAISCPECGYAIKEHFDKIRLEEERKEQERQNEIRLQEVRRKAEQKQEEEKSKIAERAKNITPPKHKPFINWYIIVGIILALLTVVMLIGGSLTLAIIEGIPAIIFLFVGYDSLKTQRNLYDKYADDTEQYKIELIKQSDLEKKQQQAVREAEKLNANPLRIKCPNCGSNNVVKISTINRVASVAAVGLASSKIGKQYQCRNCKHKW